MRIQKHQVKLAFQYRRFFGFFLFFKYEEQLPENLNGKMYHKPLKMK